MADKRPTILQIVPALDTGGAERTTLEIAAAVVKGGGRALVASEGGRLVPDLQALGGEMVFFPAATKNPARVLWNGRQLERLVRAEKIDLLHARSRAPAWSALIAAKAAGRPFVTTYHGAYSEKSRAKKLYNSVMARGDAVIANSRFTANLIRARYATDDTKLRIIYRGVDEAALDVAKVGEERLTALRRAWRLADTDRVILHMARLTRWKGQLDLVAAAERLRPRMKEALVILAGDAQGRNEYAGEVRTRADALGLDDRVRLVGHCEDVAAAYALAYVTVVASTEPEAFGRAAVEAQAMGCPVVSTALGAPPETVLAVPRVGADEATGWLIPAGNVVALETALVEALSLAPDARRAMGERARRHVLANFSTAAMQRATLAVYDELIGSDLARRFDGSA